MSNLKPSFKHGWRADNTAVCAVHGHITPVEQLYISLCCNNRKILMIPTVTLALGN